MHGFVAFILLASATPDMPHQACASQEQDWLVLPAEAEEVTRGTGDAGVWARYDVEVPYPAAQSTSGIPCAMAERGWMLVRRVGFGVPPVPEGTFPAHSPSRQPTVKRHA
jgi:hypothetical protein